MELYQNIKTLEEYQNKKQEKEAILVYFSHEECNVCKVLKPKVLELLQNDFPKIESAYVNIRTSPEIAGQERVFTVPTIVVYFGAREYIRVSRNIGVQALAQQIERPYSLMFDE